MNTSCMLIDENGNFNRKFKEKLKLAAVFTPVSVVCVIGGQSSGKSTLLNHLFGTNFEEMDAARGRFQTTKGIWVAKTSSQQACTLVIDTEGSDGKERDMDGLRQWIISYTSGEHATDRTAASGFGEYAESIWEEIKKDKDLNLPSHRIMVAEVRCKLIAKEKYECFCKDKSWLQIKKDVESSAVVQGFGKRVDSLIDNYLSQYNEEVLYYAETKRTEMSKQLTEKLLQVVEPIYLSVVEQMRNEILKNFEEAVEQELKSSGELKFAKLIKFNNEFHNQLKDAAIKQANWNHPIEQLTQLESEMTELLDRKKVSKTSLS